MTTAKIINGNCLEVLASLPEGCANLIFADPPYWMRTHGVLKRVEGTEYDGCADDWDNQFKTLADYNEFTRGWLAACRRVLSPDGSIWVIGGMQCIYTIGNALQELGYWLINDVIWHKTNPTPNFMGTRLNNSHETLIWAAKSPQSKYTFHYKTGKELNSDNVSADEYASGVRKQMGSVWRFPVCSGGERLRDDAGHKLHSTQKPYDLLYRIVCLCSSVGDTVLDPFGGTFTTGAAAKACGRNFIGIDASPKYCRCGQRRLDAAVERLGDTETAAFDEKPPRISLTELISRAYLVPDEKLFLKGTDLFAVLRSDGRILLGGQGEATDIHTGAAVLGRKRAARVNGFDFWYAERGGRRVSLKAIRDHCRRGISPASVAVAPNVTPEGSTGLVLK